MTVATRSIRPTPSSIALPGSRWLPVLSVLTVVATVTGLGLDRLAKRPAEGGSEPESAAMAVQEVRGRIDGTPRWTSHRVIRLRGPVVVEAGATLVIEPGTTVLADTDASLVVEGTLDASGTARAPIRFTTARGVERWGGLHWRTRASADVLPDCGTLQYAIVEAVAEGPALTIEDCGGRTIVEDVVVRRSGEGVRVIGGRLDLTRVYTSDIDEVGLRLQAGFVGTVQPAVLSSAAGRMVAIGPDVAVAIGNAALRGPDDPRALAIETGGSVMGRGLVLPGPLAAAGVGAAPSRFAVEAPLGWARVVDDAVHIGALDIAPSPRTPSMRLLSTDFVGPWPDAGERWTAWAE